MKMYKQEDKIIFPKSLSKEWRIELILILRDYENPTIRIDCDNWNLNCKDIIELQNICKRRNVEIISFESNIEESIISASAIGLKAFLKPPKKSHKRTIIEKEILPTNQEVKEVFFHQGTLRSGETLEADNDLLILGDINPGAIVSAGGNIMIWGRLLGIAHAGKNGNIKSKITALQLRPVQLRIANKIARGPQERPEEGLAEEATIEDNLIVIKPARTN